MLRRIAQEAIIGVVRPYVSAELPGWGRVYSALVGSFTRDAFWKDAPKRTARNKLFGYESEWDLSKWADRQAFFLRRWYDLPTQLLTLAVRADTIVDIGANRGDFALSAAAMDPGARIIAFEPNPNIAAVLRQDLQRNSIRNVEVRECALSDQEDTLTLCVPFLNSGSASFGGFVGDGYEVKVPVRIGDDELAGVDPGLIKIDVEGFELRALKGLRKTIERAQPIIETELMEDNLARCQTSSEEVTEFMRSLGYQGFGMELRREGREHRLALVELGATWDAVWLPKNADPAAISASTAELRTLRRNAKSAPANT